MAHRSSSETTPSDSAHFVWRRIAALYDEIADLDPAERERRLADPELDPEVATEVRSLLEHESAPDNPVDRAVGDLNGLGGLGGLGDLDEPGGLGASLGGEAPAEPDPTGIGPYRVLRRIGAGGMGVILLAERADGEFEKRVAIKLIKRGMDSEHLLERFRRERQILASLEHPGIARLLDGGIADDGRPYFVLEHVEGGIPIDVYSRERSLSLDQRIRLFLDACDAVHFAHQKLVLHRDLKPSNLLVSRDGAVKLLDFGIARLMEPGEEEGPSTRTLHRILTPDFAAPEHHRGEALGTYSDVYSLGVVLHQLLTGSKPEPARSAVATATPSRSIRTLPAEAARAWPGADLSQVRSALRGELDTVVAKCLEPDPADRYSSVEALAADLRRYLAGRPVLAHPPSLLYRARKLVARNPVSSALGLLAAAGFLFGAVGILWQWQVARDERDRAAAEARKSERVAQALVDVFDMSDPTIATDAAEVTLRAAIERTEAELGESLADEPEVEARMLATVGRINLNLARYQESRAQLEEALEAQRALYPDGHADTVETLVTLSVLEELLSRPQRALELAREALELQARTEEGGHSLDSRGRVLVRYADSLKAAGELDEADRVYDEARALLTKAHGEESPQVADVLGLQGVVRFSRGDYESATALVERALEIHGRHYGPVHQKVAHELNNLGAIVAAAGDHERALELHRQALETRTALFGPDHPYVAFSHFHLGNLNAREGDLDQAERSLRKALSIRRAVYAPDHRLVAETVSALADVLERKSVLDSATSDETVPTTAAEGPP